MPRSSRSKSHKHSSREYSDIDDGKKNGGSIKVSGEKKKTHANTNLSDKSATETKRRREMIHGGSDDGDDESEVVNIDDVDTVFGGKDEWPIKEEMRNIELEKELEKRMKRREGYTDKDIKHKDRVYKYSEKDSKHKGEKDSKHKGETNRKKEDEYHEDGNRGYKHKEERYRDDVERDHRHKTSRAREDSDRKKRSREHTSEFESKNLKDRSRRHRHTNNLGGSIQDQHLESKRYSNDANIDPSFERGMSCPRNDDMEVTANHSRQRSFLSCKYYPSRDHHRVSKQEETKHTDIVCEERSSHNFNSNRDLSEKVCNSVLSAKKRLKADSHLPPQPTFKAGSHSPLGFGSTEDDRGKINDRGWKSIDHDLGRTQTNWNNFPSWPYMPFHHVPPPIFNPFMYQSVPLMLGGPPMNMNHATMPYHFTDGGFGNWDHGSTELNSQPWGLNVVSDSVDLPSAVEKNEDPVHEHTDEIWSGHTGPHIEDEEKNLDFTTPEVTKDIESSRVSMVGKDDDTLISRAYLSKIDVSKDLTRPELYDQCTSILLDLDQASFVSDECDCKILFLEEGVEDDNNNNNNNNNGAALFATADDSVFKTAMSLYTKQKVCITAAGTRSVGDQEKESYGPSAGDCKVKVKVEDSCNNYDGNKEVDKPSSSGCSLGLTNMSTSDLIEFGSVNLSRIHSPESTH